MDGLDDLVPEESDNTSVGIVIPAFARLKINPVIGFLLVGMIAGPFGLGSLTGALAGSLLIATTLTFGQVFFPEFAGVLMYALLVVVLLIRPAGLMGDRQ